MMSLRSMMMLALATVALATGATACTGGGDDDDDDGATSPTPPPSFSGTIAASGSGAILTLSGGTSGTISITGDVSQDAFAPVNIDSTWTCYAPDPDNGFPNYDLIEDGQQFLISIVPTAWSVGAHDVDGTDVFVLYEVDADNVVAGDGATGAVTLNTAPMNIDAGEDCSFTMSDTSVSSDAVPSFQSLSKVKEGLSKRKVVGVSRR